MNKLLPNESELVGSWVVRNGRVVKDDVTKRIELLIQQVLRKVASDASGWDTLFRDPSDGRFWELIYPHSEMHGGGPPLLRVVTATIVHDKYKLT